MQCMKYYFGRYESQWSHTLTMRDHEAGVLKLVIIFWFPVCGLNRINLISQKSLETSQLPEDWRVATICPIYKKGDRLCPNNYRPVSLTSVVCKVLEHIVCSNIMNHLDAHGLITNRQHAFHKGRSCTTQLCTVIHDCFKTIDQGLQTDMFILDFAKVFDSVPHERLKVKLFRYGINGKTLAWINNFPC